MDGLFDLINEKEFTDSTRFRLTYDLLKSVTKVRMAKPCIKQYLWGHVDSRITEIRPDYWDIVAMLPVHNFNVNANRVYNESRKQY